MLINLAEIIHRNKKCENILENTFEKLNTSKKNEKPNQSFN